MLKLLQEDQRRVEENEAQTNEWVVKTDDTSKIHRWIQDQV